MWRSLRLVVRDLRLLQAGWRYHCTQSPGGREVTYPRNQQYRQPRVKPSGICPDAIWTDSPWGCPRIGRGSARSWGGGGDRIRYRIGLQRAVSFIDLFKLNLRLLQQTRIICKPVRVPDLHQIPIGLFDLGSGRTGL